MILREYMFQEETKLFDAFLNYAEGRERAKAAMRTESFTHPVRPVVDVVLEVKKDEEGIDYLTVLDLKQMEYGARTEWNCFLSNNELLLLVSTDPNKRFYKTK